MRHEIISEAAASTVGRLASAHQPSPHRITCHLFFPTVSDGGGFFHIGIMRMNPLCTTQFTGGAYGTLD